MCQMFSFSPWRPNGSSGRSSSATPAVYPRGDCRVPRGLRDWITELEGFHVSAGWGTYGFKAAPIVGTTLAKLVATGETPDLIAPFALERFHTDELVSELAAAAVSH